LWPQARSTYTSESSAIYTNVKHLSRLIPSHIERVHEQPLTTVRHGIHTTIQLHPLHHLSTAPPPSAHDLPRRSLQHNHTTPPRRRCSRRPRSTGSTVPRCCCYEQCPPSITQLFTPIITFRRPIRRHILYLRHLGRRSRLNVLQRLHGQPSKQRSRRHASPSAHLRHET
jgi:hypothetical protein